MEKHLAGFIVFDFDVHINYIPYIQWICFHFSVHWLRPHGVICAQLAAISAD